MVKEITRAEFDQKIEESIEEGNEERTFQLMHDRKYIDWERYDEDYKDKDHGYGKVL